MTVELHNGPENMARDCELLAAAASGTGSFRVYGWDGVWVSLGRNQRAQEVLANADVPWVIRPTGGSAVLHGHDVTVAIAIPLEQRLGARETYRLVTCPLVASLNRLGVPAMLAEELGETRAYSMRPDCFASTTSNDVVHRDTGVKICGCALRRTRGAVLLQASIPAREPSVDPTAIIRGGVRTAITDIDPQALSRELALIAFGS